VMRNHCGQRLQKMGFDRVYGWHVWECKKCRRVFKQRVRRAK